jgi:ribosomal protein S18 acetylase RimI-like enzyme
MSRRSPKAAREARERAAQAASQSPASETRADEISVDESSGPDIDVWICDFADADDRDAFARLMAEFAAEPVSSRADLDHAHFTRVADDLARRAGTLVLLAARGESESTEGVLIAFEGYSSFAQAQLFNVHDVHVAPAARGHGVGTALMSALEDLAREHRFAKVTLEVAASNTGAIALYRRLGYAGLDAAATAAVPHSDATYFATKKLVD